MWFLIVTLFPNVGPFGILMGHAFSIVLYIFLFLKFKVKFPAYFKYLLIGSIFFAATIVLSHLVNYDQIGFSLGQLRYAFVPIYWIFGLLAGVIDAKIFGLKKRDIFFSIAAIFIVAQIPLVLLQVLGFDSFLWTAEKARDWAGLLRVVGTVQNPNTLGVVTVFCIIIFAHFSKSKPFWSKVLIGLCVLIVFATGSRTSLIILLSLPIIFISKDQLFSKSFIYIVISVILLLVLFYLVLIVLKDTLPYMSQILNIIKGEGIHTLDMRFAHWENIRELYCTSPFQNKLFGFGPGYFTVLDNSYFYALYNYGISGFLFFTVLLLMLFRISRETGIKIAQRSLFVLLIFGLVADAMLNFLFMTIVYYFIGLQAYTGFKKNI
jgi:hypothetical protein